MSFFADFFGQSQQNDIKNANAQASAALKSGYDEGTAAYKTYADKASGMYDPWVASGRRGQTAYEDSLGLNGEAGGQNALTMYRAASNPSLQYEQDRAQKGLEAAANARGGLNTGYTALAAARARQGLGYQDYQNWQNRLMGVGQQGFQATGQQAGIAQQTGQYMGDARMGYGQQTAANDINYGNAMASSRNIGVNNLLGVAGAGTKAYAAYMGVPQKPVR